MGEAKYITVLVDDSAISRGIFQKALIENGKFEIAAMLSNGRKAVDYCRTHNVDLVITDYEMPEMNGIDATKIISSDFGIPVCMYSDDNSIRKQAQDAGAFLFHVKPNFSSYSEQLMAAFIEKLLNSLSQMPPVRRRIFENDSNGKFILPTAETALVNIHRGEILKEEDLPKKYFSFTPCYRREAGTSRVEERVTVRGHQFNKVEMVQYTKQGDSERAFDEMLEKAERLVQALGLHYQVSKLAAGDCSAGMCRTYDIEIWIPSMGIYKEVSSVSNSRDYQARRGNMKYRDGDTGEIKYVHTLNASGLATSRLLPALLEQNQLEDGSVLLPEVLRKYFDGKERITAD